VQKRLKAIDTPKLKTENAEEIKVLKAYLKLIDDQTALNKKIKEALADLDKMVIERYKTLTVDEIKQLVVDDKWMTVLERDVKTEMERISQRLTQRIKELAERYETTLPQQTTEVASLESKVNTHLQKMGFVWK
jgi:type I restriction enzyme M protein